MAKKAKKAGAAKKGAAAASGLTDQERLDKHLPGIQRSKKTLERAQDEAKTASGEYRAKLKAFKSDGGNIDMLIRVMSDQKREVDEVSKDLRDYSAYATHMGFPVQLDLFAPAAAKSDAKAAKTKGAKATAEANGHANGKDGTVKVLRSTKETIATARAQGKDDGEKGKTAFNPYTDASPEALAYAQAYNAAQAAIGAKFGEGRQPTTQH